MIHRSLFGSVERFFGVLTEHYAGAFPVWLAPSQVVAVPATDEQTTYLRTVLKPLRAQGVRTEVDASGADRPEPVLQAHRAQQVPLLLTADDRDMAEGTVRILFRDGTRLDRVPTDAATAAILEWIARRENGSPTAATFRQLL